MTGVSLAGTQLRVNEYAMQDHEWNDVKVISHFRIVHFRVTIGNSSRLSKILRFTISSIKSSVLHYRHVTSIYLSLEAGSFEA